MAPKSIPLLQWKASLNGGRKSAFDGCSTCKEQLAECHLALRFTEATYSKQYATVILNPEAGPM